MSAIINAAVAEALVSIAAAKVEIAALEKQIREKRQEALEPFLAALAKSGEVSMVLIRGWTPGFNDGEPCEHTTDVSVNVAQIVLNDYHEDFALDIPDEVAEVVQFDQFWNNATRNYETNQVIRDNNLAICAKHDLVYDEPSKEILNAIDEILVPAADASYGTDYYVFYRFKKDGTWTVESGDYDCGY